MRERVRVVKHTGRGLTEQSHKRECDINYVLQEYTRTGFIKHSKENKGRYDDVTVSDFQEAMFLVKNAQNMFGELPAQIRKRFRNDPGEFLEFVQDPGNADEMRKLGILKGNDGVDIKGTATLAATEESVKAAKEEAEAARAKK